MNKTQAITIARQFLDQMGECEMLLEMAEQHGAIWILGFDNGNKHLDLPSTFVRIWPDGEAEIFNGLEKEQAARIARRFLKMAPDRVIAQIVRLNSICLVVFESRENRSEAPTIVKVLADGKAELFREIEEQRAIEIAKRFMVENGRGDMPLLEIRPFMFWSWLLIFDSSSRKLPETRVWVMVNPDGTAEFPATYPSVSVE